MTPNTQAAQVGAEVTLGGQPIKIKPIGLRQVAEYERWCQQRTLKVELAAIDSLPASMRSEWMERARRNAAAVTFGSERMVEVMNTVEGLAQLVAMSIDDRHGEITGADVLDRITDINELQIIAEEADRLSFKGAGEAGKSNKPENSQGNTAL